MMLSHEIRIETDRREWRLRYYWQCSCGLFGKATNQARSARNGGARHVAAMEKK